MTNTTSKEAAPRRRTTDGITVTECRQIPVHQLYGGATSPSLHDMMPVLLACGGLMALAWSVKTVARMFWS